jgi:ABC-type sugar transport system permease subunit
MMEHANAVQNISSRKNYSLKRSQRKIGWFLVVPALCVVMFVLVYPVVQTFF